MALNRCGRRRLKSKLPKKLTRVLLRFRKKLFFGKSVKFNFHPHIGNGWSAFVPFDKIFEDLKVHSC